MKIDIEYNRNMHDGGRGLLSIFAVPSPEDIEYCDNRPGRRVGIGRGGCNFVVSPEWDISKIHPDLIALTALLAFGPFTSKSFVLDAPVSPMFAEAASGLRGLQVGPVDSKITPRSANSTSRDGVAFSGGIDSVAALLLLPSNSVPIFLHRMQFTRGRKMLYRADAAIHTCQAVARSGYDVRVIGTSLEMVRNPIGFPVDWSNSAPCVLHADALNLRSISFGMIAESAFLLGHTVYGDLSPRSVYSSWKPIFDAVALPIALPTAGLSEVNTSRLAIEHASEWQAQSCVRGTVGRGCMNCFKCFRKGLLEAKLTGQKLPIEHFDIALRQRSVSSRLLEMPIHHEDVLAYSLHGIEDYQNEIYLAMKQKTAPIARYLNGLSILDRHFTPGLKYLPDFLREPVTEKITRFFQPMSAVEQDAITNWDLRSLLDEPDYQEGQSRLLNVLGGKMDVAR